MRDTPCFRRTTQSCTKKTTKKIEIRSRPAKVVASNAYCMKVHVVLNKDVNIPYKVFLYTKQKHFAFEETVDVRMMLQCILYVKLTVALSLCFNSELQNADNASNLKRS